MPDIPLSPAAQANGVQRSWEYGLEFVTVNAPNNPPLGLYSRPPSNLSEADRFFASDAAGRGSVDHAFRISRFEVVSGNWTEFLNAAAYVMSREGSIPFLTIPSASSTNPMMASSGVSWRTAAIYCNWLHNGQALNRAAFMNGAYDASTFGYQPGTQIATDQLTHNPDARFWIPTWDEWLMAANYDPNRDGPGQGGWWAFPTSSDMLPIYGPPAVGGQSNANWGVATNGPFTIPLGAYPTIQSPWGLLDVSGETAEWTEEVIFEIGLGRRFRLYDGAAWATSSPGDYLGGRGTALPSYSDLYVGLRIAAAVPAPSAAGVTGLGLVAAVVGRGRRRVGGSTRRCVVGPTPRMGTSRSV